MRKSKLWQRFLAFLLSIAMVATSLPAGGTVYAFTGDSDAAVGGLAGDELILDEENLPAAETGTGGTFSPSDLTEAGGLQIEDILEISEDSIPDAVRVEETEPESESESESETETETESESETESGLEAETETEIGISAEKESGTGSEAVTEAPAEMADAAAELSEILVEEVTETALEAFTDDETPSDTDPAESAAGEAPVTEAAAEENAEEFLVIEAVEEETAEENLSAETAEEEMKPALEETPVPVEEIPEETAVSDTETETEAPVEIQEETVEPDTAVEDADYVEEAEDTLSAYSSETEELSEAVSEDVSEDIAVLALDTDTAVTIAEDGQVQWFRFVPEEDGIYQFSSYGQYDTIGRICADPEGQTVLAENDDAEASDTDFTLVYELKAGTTYYLSAGMCYDYVAGRFTVRLTRRCASVESVEFSSSGQTFYAGMHDASDIEVKADVTFTDGTQESLYTYYDDYTTSSVTGYRMSVSGDIKETYVSGQGDQMKTGQYTVTASYMSETWSYEIEVKNLSEAPSLSQGVPVSGNWRNDSLYRFVPESDGWYVLGYVPEDPDSVYGCSFSILTLGGGSVSYETSFTSSCAGKVYDLEAGQTYYVKVEADYYQYVVTANDGYNLCINAEQPFTGNAGGSAPGCSLYALTTEQSVLPSFLLSAADEAVYVYLFNEEWDRIYMDSTSQVTDGTVIQRYSIDTLLSPGTYHICVINPDSGTSWTLMRQESGAGMLTVDTPVSGALSVDESAYVYFQAEADALVRFRISADEGLGSGIRRVTDGGTEYLDYQSSSGRLDDTRWYRDFFVSVEAGGYYRISLDNYEDISQDYEVTALVLPTVSSIEIVSLPSKTEYDRTDSSISFEGLTVRIHYENGEYEDVAYYSTSSLGLSVSVDTNDIYDDGGMLCVGEHAVRVSYLWWTAEFLIRVTAEDPSAYPVTSVGDTVSGSFTQYDWECERIYRKLQVESGGYYTLKTENGEYSAWFGVYDDQWRRVSLITSNGAYVYYLEAGTYILEMTLEAYENETEISYAFSVQGGIPVLSADGQTEVTGATDGNGYAYFGYLAESAGEPTVVFRTSDSDGYLRAYDPQGFWKGSTDTAYSENDQYVYSLTIDVEEGERVLFCYQGASQTEYLADFDLLEIPEPEMPEADELKLNEGPYYVEIGNPGDARWFQFTPTESGRYVIYSTEDESSDYHDSYVELYANDGERIAYNDDGGEGNNFRLSCELQAGVTYYYKTRLYSQSDTGKFWVYFEKPKAVSSIEIISYPKQKYSSTESSFTYSGLEIRITYEDQTEEALRYGYDSLFGERMTVTEPSGIYENGRLKPGNYKLTVSYMGQTAEYDVEVYEPETLALTEGETLSGTSGQYVSDSWTFTPDVTGTYVIRLEQTGTDPYLTVKDSAGNNISSLRSSYFYGYWDGSYCCGKTVSYRLRAGVTYTLVRDGAAAESTKWRVCVDAIGQISAGNTISHSISDWGKRYVALAVAEAGFYRVDMQAEASEGLTNYSDPSVGSVNGYSLNYSGADGSNSYTSVVYLEAGTYTMSYYYSGAAYTLSVSACQTATLPFEKGIEAFDTEGWLVYVIRPEQTGTYMFTLEGSSYVYQSSGMLHLLDQNLNTVSSIYSSDYWYDSDRQTYFWTAGGNLEEGNSYLLLVNSNAANQSLISDSSLSANSMSFTSYPRQTYYYKLDNIRKGYESTLDDNAVLKIQYSDGTEETVRANNYSERTGMKWSMALPADARYDVSGRLMPGTYQVNVTYMNRTIQLPVTVKTVSAMPGLTLDENGEGSYTGEAENENGYGYVRFRAQEDGFYDLTLSSSSYGENNFCSIYNSSYGEMDYSADSESTDTRYLSNTTVYVKQGQTCYIQYQVYSYSGSGDGAFTLSVSRAADQTMEELACGVRTEVSSVSSSDEKWFVFTPDETARYIVSTQDVGSSMRPELYLYDSPDASGSLASTYYYYYGINGRNVTLSYTLQGDTAYYYKLTGVTGDFGITLVKAATPVGLELLTEGQIYCSTLPDNLETSLADIRFRITYADGTTEEMPFAIQTSSGTVRYTSLQGYQMDYTEPAWVKDENGTIAEQEYTIRFTYRGLLLNVPVQARSIEGLTSLEGTLTPSVGAGQYVYYRFTPETTGYYRFTASAAGGSPSVDLYDTYMNEVSADYSNAYQESGYYQVSVFALTEGEVYCLRLGHSAGSAQTVTCSTAMLSPVSEMTVAVLPQTKYYLGVDSRYMEAGLAVQITYENGQSEILEAGGHSSVTGLSLSTQLAGNDAGNAYLGSAGEKTVNVFYMNGSASYQITVMDNDSIPGMTSSSPYSGTLESDQDEIYVKYTAENSGFYWLRLEAGEGLTPQITAVQNASYTEVASGYHSLTEGADQCLVYMLAGKTYYLRGKLKKDGAASAGTYTASVAQIQDLQDGLQMNSLAGGGIDVFQFTVPATGYYQFTFDADQAVSLALYNTGFAPRSMEEGSRNDRRYYIARLQAGSIYLAAVDNADSAAQDYKLYAAEKAEVTSISLVQPPAKTVYYSQYENSLSGEGLTILITYGDGSTETLEFGQKSSWGVRMRLDASAIEEDAQGRFVAGTYEIGCVYLEKSLSFTIEVSDFDIASAEELKAETLTDVTIPDGGSAFYRFVPDESCNYRFYSRDSLGAFGAVYDENGSLLASNGGIESSDFSVTVALTAGRTYVLRVSAPYADGDMEASVRIHNMNAYTEVTGVELSEDEIVLGSLNETKQLTAVVIPEDAADTSVSWSIDTEAVASVDENGMVTALSGGSATVTVTTADGGYTDSCRVIVDLENPEITGVVPGPGSILGPTARTLWVYTSDDHGVASVEAQYRKSGTEDTYQTATGNSIDQSSVVTVDIPLDDFAHGDAAEVVLTAVDKGGRRSESIVYTYTVDKEAPAIKDLAAVYDGSVPAVTLTWKGLMEEDISGYGVYRKIQGAEDSTYRYLGSVTGYVNKEDYTFSDNTVPNAAGSYTYLVTASDQRGNSQSFTESLTVNIGTDYVNHAPTPILNCASTMVSGREYSFDLSASTDNGSIVSWTMDFGDNSGTVTAETKTDAVFKHTYTLPEGTAEASYTVTATVTDNEGLSAEVTKTIRVIDLSNAGMLTVRVVDTDGIPLGNAPVYFNMGEDGQTIGYTDSTGEAEFTDVPGIYAVGCYVSGYLPCKTNAELRAEELSELTIVLEEKELVEGQFESHRMTLDEIRQVEEETGVTITSDPENSHVVKYEVTLEYTKINIYYGGDEPVVIGEGNNCTWVPVVLNEEIVVILEIPVGVSILKEFYSVKLYIMNNAASEFSLLENHVKLNVPEGLTLMADASNPAEVDIDEIKGQTTEVIEWIVRGDKSGEYQLSADYSGLLSDFAVPLTATFTSDEKLKVYGVDNLSVTMQIPDTFTNGEFYYNLIMTNTAAADDNAADMYLPNLTGEGELLQTMLTGGTEGTKYLSEMPEVLRGGESIERFYRITDQISEQLKDYPNYEDFVFQFTRAWTEELTSYGVKLNLEKLSADVLAAKYESYRALPATSVTVTVPELEYGYASGTGTTLSAEAEPAGNGTYTITYEWYDTNYDRIGTGETYTLPSGLEAGTYHYHCVAVSTRTDNGNRAQTQYQDVVVTVSPKTAELVWSGTEERTYDGQPSSVTAAISGLPEGTDCAVTVTGGDAVNAGEHTATATELTGDAAKNYQLPENASVSYKITPLTAELEWSGAETREYDGTPSDVQAAVKNLVTGDECIVTVSGGTEENAGSHTAKAEALTGEDAGNYQLPADVTCAYEITQKTVTLSWPETPTKVYDGAPMNLSATVGGLIDSDTCSATVSVSEAAAVGNYEATATGLAGTDAGNYQLPAEGVTCGYTITPKTVELSWTGNAEREYDGNASAVTATAVGLIGEDDCTVTVTGGTEINAGTYMATATALTGEDAGNYQLPAEEGVTCSYTITPKTVELSWTGNTEREYDGTASAVTATATGLVVGDTCIVTVTGGDAKDAGTYTATAAELTGEDAGNYQLPTDGTQTCGYVITAKPVTLTWSGTESRTYDGVASTVTAAVASGLIDGDSCTVTVSGGDAKDAGTHTAAATSLSNGNYQLPTDGTQTCSYEILPKTVDISWSGYETRTYNGAASAVMAAVNGLVEGDSCGVAVTGGNEKTAGVHEARITGLDNANYQLSENAVLTQSYTIEKATAAIGWTGYAGLEYSGNAAGVQATVTNLASGDDCSVVVNGGDGVTPGEYTAEATGLQGSDAANYELTAESGSLTQSYTIAPRIVTLGWTGTEKVYDGAPASVQAAVTNLVSGDICSVTVAGGNATDAGTYTATATALSNGNYQLPTGAAQTYTIAKRTAELGWSGTAARTYDGKASAVQAAVTNLVSGDTCGVTVAGGNAKDAGTHTATATALSNGNYQLPMGAAQTYTIAKRTAELGWSGTAARTYDGQASAVQATVTNLVSGDTCSVTVAGGNAKDAGTHTATATALSNGNYQLPTGAAQTYTIAKRTAELSWSGTATRTYNKKASAVKAVVSNLVSGDTCSVTVSGGTAKKAGTHTAKAKSLSNANYELPENAFVTYKINKAAQKITNVKSSYKLVLGKSTTLKPKASGKGKLTYKTSSKKIVTVSSKGKTVMKKTGRATITITAAATTNYKKVTKKITFTVIPKKAAISKVTSPKRRQLKLTWKKLTGVSGYEIQYSTSSKFTKSKTKTVTVKASAKTKTLTKLTAGKRYYVRIRGYKTISKKKYYGSYSSVKKITVKK